MNKREARRLVLHAVAATIEGNVDTGAEYLHTDEHGNELSESDQERVKEAALELADSLRLRATPPVLGTPRKRKT